MSRERLELKGATGEREPPEPYSAPIDGNREAQEPQPAPLLREQLTVMTDEPQTVEDQNILGIARELCEQLRIAQFKPESLTWVTWLFTYRQKMLLPSDHCIFSGSEMTLQKMMRGRLTPEEWKPLIASSLIYEFSPDVPRKLYFGRGLRIAPAFILALGPIFLIRLFLPSVNVPALAAIGYFFAVMFTYSTLFWDVASLRKRLRLKADKNAARLVGKELFLTVLRKVDAMGLVDVVERKAEKLGWTLQRTPYPSITQRIENLKY